MKWRRIGILYLLLIALLLVMLTACNLQPDRSTTDGEIPTRIAPTESISSTDGLLTVEDPPRKLLRSHWETDFSRRIIEWDEIASGGPPKDGIAAVDNPGYESNDLAASWLTDQDPVILFEHDSKARAFPLAILIWHEIVNTELAGVPIAVTFCPLCNASIVFDRSFDGQVLDFGTTGLLRNSDLIMYDRQTETWWQQFVGQGIVGEYAGGQLTFLPSQVVSFGDFRVRYPDGEVLARPASTRSYGQNPYAGYDSTQGRPFLYGGELDTRLDATERVVGVALGDDIMAYPFTTLTEVGVLNDTVGDTPLVIMHNSGTASALDASTIAEGRDVGSTAVYDRRIGNQTLTFVPAGDGLFVDEETGSIWNIFGESVEGDFVGQQLEQIISFDHFWFAWVAFHPDTGLYVP